MELQPRSVGELLSDALALLRRHARLVALVALPFCALELVLRDALFSLFPALSDSVAFDASLDEATAVLARLTTAGLTLGFALSVLGWLLALATSTLTAGALFGQRLEPMAVARGALRHIGRVLLTGIVWFLTLGLAGVAAPAALVVGLVFITIDPVALFVAGLVGLLWAVVVFVSVSLSWALWPQVMALEGLSSLQALRRSRRLMGPAGVPLSQSPKFRLSLLVLVYFAVQSAVQSLFLLPTLAQGLGQTPPFSGDTSLWSMPLYFGVPLALLQVASNSLLLPLSAVLSTLFYFDVRVRYEGYDLDVADASEGAA